MALSDITDIILDESSSTAALQEALDHFALLCSEISGITPDPSFSGWADDSFLAAGVAINPQAAAYCIKDYQRSVVFIRGVYAAIKTAQQRFPDTVIKLLYAGCGPFATLVLPLLVKFRPGELQLHLLDIHQQSLDSVCHLLKQFGLNDHRISTHQGDACHYRHAEPLHLIIAETMQKALEQEPQFAVTANLAPQLCSQGIFIPEAIEVELCLAHWQQEQAMFKRSNTLDVDGLIDRGQRHSLGTLFTLRPEWAASQINQATHNDNTSMLELPLKPVQIPTLEKLASFDVLLLTRIQVFAEYHLKDYEAAITLPLRCHELLPLREGAEYQVCYQFGNYPRFNITRAS